MIIWSGKGWYAFGILFFLFMLFGYLDKKMPLGQLWFLSLTFVCSGLVVYLLSQYAEKQRGRIVQDKETEQIIELREYHTLFFIDIKYWAILYLIIGIFYAFASWQGMINGIT